MEYKKVVEVLKDYHDNYFTDLGFIEGRIHRYKNPIPRELIQFVGHSDVEIYEDLIYYVKKTFNTELNKMSSLVIRYTEKEAVIGSDSRGYSFTDDGYIFNDDIIKIAPIENGIIGITGRTDFFWKGEKRNVLDICKSEINDNIHEFFKDLVDNIYPQLEVYEINGKLKEDVVNIVYLIKEPDRFGGERIKLYHADLIANKLCEHPYTQESVLHGIYVTGVQHCVMNEIEERKLKENPNIIKAVHEAIEYDKSIEAKNMYPTVGGCTRMLKLSVDKGIEHID